MAYRGNNNQLERQTNLRPIVKPGTSEWKAFGGVMPATSKAAFLGLVGLSAWLALVTWGIAVMTTSPALGAAILAVVLGGGLGGAAVVISRTEGVVVSAANLWSLGNQRIHGEAFAYLEDIDGRFAFAEKLIKEIPTGIDWVDVADDVAALRWEAAEHAAKASAIDEELHDFRYAAAGTPQATLKKALEKRRSEHKDVLIDLRWEADSLARVAGNALAAAKVALAATGDVHRLDAVTPSREALVASANLAGAKARMKLLTEVWAELDPSGTLLQEQLPELDPPTSNPPTVL